MTGRVEKEIKSQIMMQKKLEDLPDIFTVFYNWMDARDRSYTTIKNYINHVIEFMIFFTKGKRDNLFYEKVTDVSIEKYMTSIKRKEVDGKFIEVGDEIRASKWSSLNTFFKFLTQKKYIEENPMLLTERPRVKTQHDVTYMTPEEIQSVFNRIASESKHYLKNRDMCIMAMGLSTGLRVSAMVNINIEDVDFETQTIRVIEKGRKVRNINFAENLKNLLLIWINDRKIYFDGEDTGPLFISRNKNRISIYSVEEMVSKYTNHLSKHITPHKLRSSAAMNLHGAGVDVLTIASILGHENVTTTQRYVKAYDSAKKEATNVLDNLI